MLQNHFRFPLKSVAFMKVGGSKVDFAQSVSEGDENKNILMEKKLLKSYNRCFLSELGLYGVVVSTILYFSSSMVTGIFSLRVANYCLIAPGITLSAGNFYFRTMHHREFEQQLRGIYKHELGKYERFF